MKKKILIAIIFILLSSILLSSCIPGDGKNTEERPAGFFWGVWHGWIAPISLIGSIFNRSLTIYERANKGFSYDIGFYLAIISGFGGLSLTRRKGKRD